MPKRSTPEQRANKQTKEIQRVRRKYKVNTSKRRKLGASEAQFVLNSVVLMKLAGYSNRQIATFIGISKGQVREILDTGEAQEMLALLRDSIPKAAMELIQGLMIEAVTTIADIMRTESDNKIVLQAAGEILDRGGMPKASRQERHQVNEDRTTFTDEGLLERLRDASPEVQEAAAQMIEGLEQLLEEHADRDESETQDEPSE